jgi:hypothetical protein
MRHLQLILQVPHGTQADALSTLAGLDRLASRGRPLPTPACASEAYCLALGINRQQDWPIAPFTARASGLEVGDAYWLRLDPVYLDVGMQGPFLRGGLALEAHEEVLLLDIVQPILARGGLQAFPGPGGVIHVRCATPPRLATTPLDQVDGRQPTRFLPTGGDAPAWSRLLHELQMSLHEHPLNQARRSRGQPPVNSFWPWGGGRFAPPPRHPDAIWGTQPLLEQLATALAIPIHPCPVELDPVLREKISAGLALVPMAFTGPGQVDETWGTAWLRPLASALRWTRLASARICIPGAGGGMWDLSPRDLWRVWQ